MSEAGLTENAKKILEERYLKRDEEGNVEEAPEEMFERVARAVAEVNQEYEDNRDFEEEKTEFYEALTDLDFIPNSPTLMNAGLELGQLSACFVLSPLDNMDSIFQQVKNAAKIFQSGGGVGYTFSRLRPRGDTVKSTGGVASGPVSFMKVYDEMCNTIKQGGRRRGAQMAVLSVQHPDIEEFIEAKDQEGELENFNISVALTEEFMEAVDEGEEYPLINPKNDDVEDHLDAQRIYDKIVDQAWKNGEPGILFLDRVNEDNPFDIERHPEHYIDATNPCVTGDTLISTKEGTFTAEELCESEEDLDIVVDGRLSEEKFKEASNVFKTGTKDVFNLKTKEGYEIRLTDDHRMMNSNGWKKVKDLEVGEKVHIIDRKTGFTDGGSLEEGLVLGWIVGYGQIKKSENRVTLHFYDKDTAISEEYAEYVNSIIHEAEGNGDYEVGVQKIDRGENSVEEQRVRSTRLFEITEKYDLNEDKLQVPEELFRGGKKTAKGFLKGLFTADGSVRGDPEKGVSVRLSSSELDLLKEVQQLLLGFGIKSKIYEERRKEGKKELPDGKGGSKMYRVRSQHDLMISKDDLKRFRDEIGFVRDDKNKRLEDLLDGYERGPSLEKSQVTVDSIEYDGHEDVYDLTEPDTNSFVANGFVVHNCGEQPLEDFEACNLGHINLSQCVDDGEVDWDKLEDLTDLAVRFLDNVIDASDFPNVRGYDGEEDAITRKVKENRKIGLGVMGWHHMLMRLGIPYDSEEAVDKAEEVMGFIQQKSNEVSKRIAENRGEFPSWDESEYEEPMRNATTTTIAPTGCVKTDTLISTESGLEEIQGFQGTRIDDRWSETKISKVESDEGTVEAVRHFDNGKAVVEKIVTEEGFEVTATPDHKFRVVDEEGRYSWKETQDIEEKDRIVLKRNNLEEEYRPVKLGTSEHENFHHNTSETLKLPEEVTEELAEFLGYYMGDGYVHEDVGVKLIVASDQEELEHHLKDLGEKVFGVEPTIEDKGSRKMLCFGGRHLPRYFTDNGWRKEKGNKGEGAASASIPEQVMRSGRKPAKAFLRGLFEADGCFSRKVELSTVSKKLSKQVQILLLNLGIVFKRERRSAEELGDDHYGEKDRYVVRGLNKSEDDKFLNQVGFITKAPEQELELTPHSFKNDDFPPVMVEELTALAVFNDLNPDLKHRVRQSQYQVLTKRTAEKVVENTEEEDLMVKRFIENDFFLGTVKEKEKGTARTHDLEVPENNTYIANGFVSHNTTSMIADTSGGIEPVFAVSYVKNVLDDESLIMPDPVFEEIAKERGFYSDELMKKIAEVGSVTDIDEVPDDLKPIFKTALEISPEWHIKMQAAFQESVDNAISKTVNFPNEAAREDIKEVYDLAYQLECKGVTVYRSGSRQEQVMEVEGEKEEEEEAEKGLFERRPRERPTTVEGTTQKINTGYGGLYVTINEDEHGLFEVFSQIGRAGGFTQSFTESLARLISLCLRSSIPPEEIIEQLEGIRSPEVAFEQGEKILSIPDAMAKALKWHREGKKLTEQTQLPTDEGQSNSSVKEMVAKGLNPACPDCGSMLTLTEGCRTCPNCGYSQC